MPLSRDRLVDVVLGDQAIVVREAAQGQGVLRNDTGGGSSGAMEPAGRWNETEVTECDEICTTLRLDGELYSREGVDDKVYDAESKRFTGREFVFRKPKINVSSVRSASIDPLI